MTLGACLAVGCILALLIALPTWGYGDFWSYTPVAFVALSLILLVVLALHQKV